MARFDGKAFGARVVALQKQQGVTNEELARRQRCSLRSVERLRSGAMKRPPKPDNLERLAKALNTSPDVLLGKAPLPDKQDAGRLLADLGYTSFTLLMPPEKRNALALTALRYRVTPTFVLKLAPLLFDIAARQSLRARKESIEDVERRQAAVREMQSRVPHLPSLATCAHHAQDAALAAEERSIAAHDLFADSVRADKSLNDYWLEDDFNAPNPFQAFLSRLAEEAGCGAQIEEVARNEEPRFTILRDEALSFAGGDEELAESILDGSIPLSELPKGLHAQERLPDRLAWLRVKRDEALAKLAAWLEPAEINPGSLVGEGPDKTAEGD
jgi:transcriptional regulator with XRE-family HTH domain